MKLTAQQKKLIRAAIQAAINNNLHGRPEGDLLGGIVTPGSQSLGQSKAIVEWQDLLEHLGQDTDGSETYLVKRISRHSKHEAARWVDDNTGIIVENDDGEWWPARDFFTAILPEGKALEIETRFIDNRNTAEVTS